MTGMKVIWLIVGPLIGWLIGSVIADSMFAVASVRTVESRIFEEALPIWFGAFGLAAVILVRVVRNDD
jgi:hypothetical protein